MAATDVSRTDGNREHASDDHRATDSDRAGLLARVPGIMYVLAALLVTSMGVSGAAAPAAVLDAADAPDIAVASASTGETDPSAAAAVDEAPAMTLEVEGTEVADDARSVITWPPQTGQRLTPEQIEQAKAMFAALQSEGLHRGPGVVESWEPAA